MRFGCRVGVKSFICLRTTGSLKGFLISGTLDGAGSRVRFCVGQLFDGVSLHLGRVHGVEGLSFKLKTITKVDLLLLLHLGEEGHSAGPGAALNNNDTEVQFCGGGVRWVIVGHVAVGSDAPGWSVTLACLVKSDRLEAGLLGIFGSLLFLPGLDILDTFGSLRLDDSGTSAVEDRSSVVDPHVGVGHLGNSRHGNGTLLWHIFFNF